MSDNPHYPLRWPFGWPRTPKGDRLSGSAYKVDSNKARRELDDELRKLGGENLIINSNVAVRGDGTPYADAARRRIDDPGVAIYFTMNGKTMVMARDKYANPQDNLRDLGLAVRDMRSLELHGGSTMVSRAFEGFTALPPPPSCWQILGITGTKTHQTIMASFRIKAKEIAAGNGGDMDYLVKARDNALKEIS